MGLLLIPYSIKALYKAQEQKANRIHGRDHDA